MSADGNCDGNVGSRQRPEAAINNQLLSHEMRPELGIRYSLISGGRRSDGTTFVVSRSMSVFVSPWSGSMCQPSSATHAPGVRPRQGRPGAARPGWRAIGAAPGRPTALTDLLTTTLDYPGHRWNEQPSEQGRCGSLDSRGRL